MLKFFQKLGPVTKIENIKTDSTKILRPTHFSGPKDIKTDQTSGALPFFQSGKHKGQKMLAGNYQREQNLIVAKRDRFESKTS